jgi:hypothetical protein
VPDKKPVRLSEERRARLLAAMGASSHAGTTPGPRRIVAIADSRKQPWWSWRAPQIYFALSGMAALGLIALYIAPHPFTKHKDLAAIQRVEDGRRNGQSAINMPSVSRGDPDASQPAVYRTAAKNRIERDPSQREASKAKTISRPTLANSGPEYQNTRGAVVSAEGPPPVKLDAFVVAESRGGGYASAAKATPASAPLLAADLSLANKPRLTLGAGTAAAPLDGMARFDGAESAAGKNVPNEQLQFVTGSAFPDDKRMAQGASSPTTGSGSSFGSGLDVGSVTLGPSGQIASDTPSRANSSSGNKVAFRSAIRSPKKATLLPEDELARLGVSEAI